MSTGTGLEIYYRGQRTRLKWHQLRKSTSDPVFDLEVMREGFRLGASMELDLRVRRDGGFVVLHDETLDRETDGSGTVSQFDRAELDSVRYARSGLPLLTSEALAEALGDAHPETVLQFDLKDDLARIGEKGLRHIEEIIGPHRHKIIISSLDLPLIAAAREVIPSVPRGIDPTGDMAEAAKSDGVAGALAALEKALAGPSDAGTVYLHWSLITKGAEADQDLIGTCHQAGKLVDAWTFNLKSPETGFSDEEWGVFQSLVEARVDQITTDEAPATERAWLKRITR